MKPFERLFSPRSSAVVGVSDDSSRPGSQAVHTLLRNGYAGRIYPVNPGYPEYEGLKCYPSVAAIEDEIDVFVDIRRAGMDIVDGHSQIKPAPRKKGPIKKPPDRPLPNPDTA